jgi:hypothetical protein
MKIDDVLRSELPETIPALCLLGGFQSLFGIKRAPEIAEWFAHRGLIILGVKVVFEEPPKT